MRVTIVLEMKDESDERLEEFLIHQMPLINDHINMYEDLEVVEINF